MNIKRAKEEIKDSIEAYQQYFDQYPTGKYAEIAQKHIASQRTTPSNGSIIIKNETCDITLDNSNTTYIPKPRQRATTLHSIDIENNTTRVSNMMPQASYSQPIGISMLTLWKNIFQRGKH